MLQKESFAYVGDNTGANFVKIIHLYGGFFRKSSTLGDFILIVIQKRRRLRQFITKNIYLSLIVTIKRNNFRFQGYYLKFIYNKVILLHMTKKFLATRFFGPIAKEVRTKTIEKIFKLIKYLC